MKVRHEFVLKALEPDANISALCREYGVSRKTGYKWLLGRSHREVAKGLSVSAGVVGSMLARAAKAGVTMWSEVEALDDVELDQRLYGRKLESTRPLPDCAWIHAERSRPGVTLQLLHHEYLERHPLGYQYTRFCDFYREWLARRHVG